jgi:hypothetical protein
MNKTFKVGDKVTVEGQNGTIHSGLFQIENSDCYNVKFDTSIGKVGDRNITIVPFSVDLIEHRKITTVDAGNIFQFKGKKVSILQVRSELGSRYFLAGLNGNLFSGFYVGNAYGKTHSEMVNYLNDEGYEFVSKN